MTDEDFERCAICNEPRNFEDLSSCRDCALENEDLPLIGECCWIEHAKTHR